VVVSKEYLNGVSQYLKKYLTGSAKSDYDPKECSRGSTMSGYDLKEYSRS